jgi:hypothetical protein
MRKKIMIIKAIKQNNGYTLRGITPDGTTEYPRGEYIHATRKAAYAACDAMYKGTTWQGCKVSNGYRIIID